MRYLPSFNVSFEQELEHYAAADAQLAKLFVKAADRARDWIIRFPKSGKKVKSYRATMLERFPYSFCYTEDLDGDPVALILYHHKQSGPTKV
jgi:hypothetical protein